MDVSHVIKTRRSSRRFKDRPSPRLVIYQLLENARLSPFGGNSQGWHFGAITDPGLIQRLLHAAGDQHGIAAALLVMALCADVGWDLSSLPEGDYRLVVNYPRFTPDFIAYLRNYSDARSASLLFNNSSPLISVYHIYLTAVNHGLGASWIGDLDVTEASSILGLPDQYACLFLMPVGYPNDSPRPVSRKSLEDISFHNRFGNRF